MHRREAPDGQFPARRQARLKPIQQLARPRRRGLNFNVFGREPMPAAAARRRGFLADFFVRGSRQLLDHPQSHAKAVTP